MKNVPIRHHFIPQFVLRQFCYEDNLLWFKHKDTGVVESLGTRDLFMEKNLYYFKDDDADYYEIENALADYENEISRMLIDQFYDEKIIHIMYAEQESIKLFYAIMGFRSKRAADYFKNSKDKGFVDYYSIFQNDNDFEAFWKRNLKELVKCRSFLEVSRNPNIDKPVKVFMLRDTTGIFGSYLKVVETINEEFILTDSYPLVIFGNNAAGMEINLYEVFPISPKRAILIVYDKVDELINFNDSILPKGFFTKPEVKDGVLELYVKKMKDETVRALNAKTEEINQIGTIIHNY